MKVQGRILLETSDRGRRISQQAGPLAGGLLLIAGILVLAHSQGGLQIAGGLLAAAGAGAAYAGVRLPVAWEIGYKGHVIRFESRVVSGATLALDGERIRGGRGRRRTLRGTLSRGPGLGDRIAAECEAGLTRLHCRIVVESPPERCRSRREWIPGGRSLEAKLRRIHAEAA